MLKEWVKQELLSRGIVLSKPPGQFDVLSYKLADAKKRGLKFDCIVDGGASDGSFARQIKRVFPDSTILCIEPRDDAQSGLQETQREFSNIQIAHALIGPSEGSVEFNVFDAQSSVLPNSRGQYFGETKTVPMTTLDALIAKMKLPWPDLIKLDLQGFELSALQGAEECMKHAQALLLECSFIPIQQGMPLVADVISFVSERGFVIYDIPALWHRPLDGALAQGDFLFLKRDHPLRNDPRWSVNSEFA